MLTDDIGILGMGMWHGPAVTNDRVAAGCQGEWTVQDPYLGSVDQEGNFRLLGLALPAQQYPRTLAIARRTMSDPFRGAVHRRVFPADMPPSAAEAEAAEEALSSSGVAAGQIGAVLVQSTVPDSPYPSNAALVAHQLGVRDAAVWSLDGSCAGPIAQLGAAASLIASGTAEFVLCVQSCAFTRVNDPQASSYLGVGDLAAAFMVGRKEGARIAASWSADGSLHGATTANWQQGSSAVHTWWSQNLQLCLKFDHALQLTVLKTLAERLRTVTARTLGRARWQSKDVAVFVPQQSTAWVPAYLSEALDIPAGALFHTYDEYANVGPVNISAGWYQALREGRIHDGSRVLAGTGGAGFVYAAAAVQW
ncbi:3-oxoacyl-ACP synthase III family protein [Streptomyces albireticuli]|uniref:3-oxoacyl-ACP synthase n=1 Tax=Streptomyces albireticuli TaxID=1940 RepID=A0A2A2D143_9ACTN|nr:3-oxoacyl-[acyl-carrier-protein] synthase III C-terminal domain-containing protein [Streptomyces albireticuli]MCD9145730.1 hypothetical protein [Streptomyces albireticuli]MCD9165538.1 hypothetical protein [Streptomyces albireticuli]MCD9195939.1 hypothetical protein [Streptomyces albireticuli]PAU45177.1 hypothetical protein CK936_30940 [Streptomyces albireticuli]